MARDLIDEVTDKSRVMWRASGPIDWANESFAISISPEVEYCVRRGTGCWYDADNERLDPGEAEKLVVINRAYIEVNAPTHRERLEKSRRPTRGSPESGARGLSSGNERRFSSIEFQQN